MLRVLVSEVPNIVGLLIIFRGNKLVRLGNIYSHLPVPTSSLGFLQPCFEVETGSYPRELSGTDRRVRRGVSIEIAGDLVKGVEGAVYFPSDSHPMFEYRLQLRQFCN
jgi:hypothetical protein